jgi:hypothetical protein
MSDGLAVDPLALREEVRSKYRAIIRCRVLSTSCSSASARGASRIALNTSSRTDGLVRGGLPIGKAISDSLPMHGRHEATHGPQRITQRDSTYNVHPSTISRLG